jgi:uncharacterized protein (TIGR02757 family)
LLIPDKKIKERLDYHYKAFDKSQISPDPLETLHNYRNPRDIEAVGFIASVFAYGNVRQILASIRKIEEVISRNPYEFIVNYDFEKDKAKFERIKHRFYTSSDIAALFEILHNVYVSYGSLKKLFLLYYFEKDDNIKESLSRFSSNLLSLSGRGGNGRIPTEGLSFMFPDPAKGSACKRMNLFLRWMVRKDELDFGLWKEIPPNKLVIPVDTHIARVCSYLNLTSRKNVSWKMAEEITDRLRTFDPSDPVKYDFAICHIGMRKLSF